MPTAEDLIVPVIPIDVFNVEVGVFTNDASRVKTLAQEGCDAEAWDAGALSSAHVDTTEDGHPRFSFVIKPEATRATWAHECSHMADFLCDCLGMPISLEATEIRAYLVGHLMAGLEDLLEPVGGSPRQAGMGAHFTRPS